MASVGRVFTVFSSRHTCSVIWPAARRAATMTASADETRFWLFGGCCAEGRTAELHRFDATTHVWTLVWSKPRAPARGLAKGTRPR